jgi:hypothetical protein
MEIYKNRLINCQLFQTKHPNIPQGHYELGLANFRFGDVNTAVEELSRAG